MNGPAIHPVTHALYVGIVSSGGATVDDNGDDYRTGYAVALHHDDIAASVTLYRKLRSDAITSWRAKGAVIDAMRQRHPRASYRGYGAWVSDGLLWLSPTDVFPDLDTALAVARERSQRYVYDFANGTDIAVESEVGR